MIGFTLMADGSICVALLAAGKARRFGGGKLDAICAGKPLGQWAIDAAKIAGLPAGICITGPQSPQFLENSAGWRQVINRDPSRGLGSSIALAAHEAERLGGESLLVMLADMPLVSAEFLRDLAAQKGVAATDYDPKSAVGRVGVPALFPARLFGRLKGLTGDRGAALLLATMPDLIRVSPTENMLIDVDITSDIGRVEDALRQI